MKKQYTRSFANFVEQKAISEALADGPFQSCFWNYVLRDVQIMPITGLIDRMSSLANDYGKKVYDECQAMEEIADQFKPKWIPVSERLPEADTRCLVWIDVMDEAVKALWDGDAWFWFGGNSIRGLKNVTHWMPLPEKPS